MLIFTFTDPSALIFVLGFLFYLALVNAERIKHSQTEVELILFSTLLVTWLTFLTFKKPLLNYGLLTIWQNVPEALISSRFVTFDPLEAIYSIGIIPFFAAAFVVYRYMLREKLKQIYLLMSFAVVIFLLLWLQLVELKVGLFFLGAIVAVLFSQFYKIASSYIDKTKFARLKVPLLALFAIALVVTSVWPSITFAQKGAEDVPLEEVINALYWVRNNTEEDSVILAPVEFGHLVTSVGKRRNVIDSNFLFAKDIEERFSDVNNIYSTSSETEAIRLLNKYHVDYIIPTEVGGRVSPAYLESNKECFKQVYYQPPLIYSSVCDVT
jgi:hypothetical protein